MNAKGVIKKVLFISMWLVIATGMVILLAAAVRKQKNNHCKDYSITIKGTQNNFFINEKDVQQLIMVGTNGTIKGQPLSSFNLHQLEQLLEDNTWINDAELYFDNRDVLHITVKEREPIARIFTTTGSSFYIDSKGKHMPLSERMSARVPVFTGFPSKNIASKNDQKLLDEVRLTAKFIFNDPFWMAQTAQIDITPVPSISSEWNFEMIPVVGNHTVKLGDGENIDEKFHRLMVFYKQILSKTGFDKYKMIDVQYAGQVVASKQTGNAKVDMKQLQKNVEKLLQEATENNIDTITIAEPKPVKIETPITKPDSTTHKLIATNNNSKTKLKATLDPNAVKTTPLSNKEKVPKAVMPKRE